MNTVLLLLDLQNNIVERYPFPDVVARAAQAADAARAAGIPVVYVRVAFREGAPEVGAANRRFAAVKSGSSGGENAAAVQVIDAVAPRPGEAVVIKRRVSAFVGSDLDVILRAEKAERLVLAGLTTSGVMLSTVMQAADLDFELVVLADACADADDEVHRVLIDKVFPRAADVVTTAEWTASLRSI